jgi:hypothetical protein
MENTVGAPRALSKKVPIETAKYPMPENAAFALEGGVHRSKADPKTLCVE